MGNAPFKTGKKKKIYPDFLTTNKGIPL